jgi:hypothetical protein
MRMGSVAVVGLLAIVSCKNEQEQKQHDQAVASAAAIQAAALQQQKDMAVASAAAAQALADDKAAKLKAAADARAAVQQHPDAYLKTSNPQTDNGLFNNKRLLTTVTVLNTSHFALTDLSGTVSWTDGTGASIGTTPFSLAGSIAPGATMTFATANRTLSSGAAISGKANPQITFTHVTIVGS